jgi:hypothetical protein
MRVGQGVGRRGKLWDDNKLVVVTLFTTKNRKEKKMAMTRLCRHLLCFKQKRKNEKKR